MRPIFLLAFSAALSFLAGCSTVESRIKERPDVFNKLSESQKTLVTRGEVTEEMTPDAVYLAWGKPDQVVRGSERKKPVQEWVYEATRSEFVSTYRSVPVYYGRGGRYYGGWEYVFDPVVVSETYPYKSVLFEEGRVVAWRKSPLR